MSVATVVEVPISQTVYQRLKRRADARNVSVTEVVEDVVREVELAEEKRREAFRRMGEVMKSLQEEALLNGTSTMTMDEINEEIALARQEAAELAEQRKTA